MAVFTKVEQQELALFLAGYNVGKLQSFSGIEEGVENTNYRIETSDTALILTLYEKRVDSLNLPYFFDLMNHLEGAGLPCPKVLTDLAGNKIGRLNDRPAAVQTFLSGQTVKTATPELARQTGALLARMHRAGQSFKKKRLNELSLAGWHQLAEETKDRAGRVIPGLDQVVSMELTYLDDTWPHQLPVGQIHADLFPDNVMAHQGQITGVIDFYFAATDMLAYDLAVTLNAWCFDNDQELLVPIAKNLLEGYESERVLTDMERSSFVTLCRGAALRFLLTRLYDWLNPVEGALVTPKDPTAFYHRLLVHQKIRDFYDYVEG